MVDFRMPDHICAYLVIHVAICVFAYTTCSCAYTGIKVPIHLRLGL